MSLTKGTGPFGEQSSGSFNFNPQAPEHVLHVERSPRRVRVLLGEHEVADSDDVRLLHPPGRTPTYLFPRIALVRLSTDQTTRDYVARRVSEGKSKTEAMRCLKRYIAREMFNALPKAALV
jgi:hypothetical protein